MSEHLFPASMSGSICLDKIDKQYIYEVNGKKYLNLRFKYTPDSQYGNDYMISQDVDKETREQCKTTGSWPKTPILGNAKAWNTDVSTPPSHNPPTKATGVPAASGNDDNLPF